MIYFYDENDTGSDLADRAMWRLDCEEWKLADGKCSCGNPIELWEYLYFGKCRACRTKELAPAVQTA